MRERGQILAAVFVVVAVVAGGVFLEQEVGPRAAEPGPAAGVAPSGAWLCPHGGGNPDWEVTLEIANPGPDPVQIRVRNLSGSRPTDGKSFTVAPGTGLHVPAPAGERGSSSFVEYFGGWVAAGWVAHGGGGEGGVAAEPCISEAGRSWFLPDNTTAEHQDAYVVVMNPFASAAVFSLILYSERRRVAHEDWTDVALRPFQSTAFELNTKLLGETTVAVQVEAKLGRVAVSSLGISEVGGIRSAVGIPADAAAGTVLPGGFDQGRTDLLVMNTSEQRQTASGAILSREGEQAVGSLAETGLAATAGQTYPVTTEGPTTLHVAGSESVWFARRTYGKVSDQGSTPGAATPGRAWVILPAVAGAPSHAGLVLANPGDVDARVTLSFLPAGTEPPPPPVVVTVPARRSVAAPKEWVRSRPLAAVLAIAESGTFVPAAASYSLGREGYATYAVSVGVPVPDPWVPA